MSELGWAGLVMWGLCACGPEDSGSSLGVWPDAMTIIETDGATLNALPYPGLDTDLPVSWWSSDASVATVDDQGRVQSVGPGDVQISASWGDRVGTAWIRVLSLNIATEALILGTGPFTTREIRQGCGQRSGSWRAFPLGSTIELVFTPTVPNGARKEVIAAAEEMIELTQGQLDFVVRDTENRSPKPRNRQVTITRQSEPAPWCERSCAIPRYLSDGSRRSTEIVVLTRASISTYVHEIGHGILGLCHIHANMLGGGPASIMEYYGNTFPDRMTTLDKAVVRRMYASGVQPGAGRAEMIAAGLINP